MRYEIVETQEQHNSVGGPQATSSRGKNARWKPVRRPLLGHCNENSPLNLSPNTLPQHHSHTSRSHLTFFSLHQKKEVGNDFQAAAAAKLLQLCLTLCNPIDSSLPGSSVPGILQARILEWVAISFSNACMHAKSLQSCLTLCDPMDSSPPGSSVHGILQAKVLEWIAISFSRFLGTFLKIAYIISN